MAGTCHCVVLRCFEAWLCCEVCTADTSWQEDTADTVVGNRSPLFEMNQQEMNQQRQNASHHRL